MTHIDLLNFIIDVQNIPKNELAELIGVPLKKMDDVLSGAMPLKKKWLKNLSLFTGIPKEAIQSGNFALNYPEGEVAPALDVYVPEAIREENTRRLNFYSKKRYKSDYQDVVLIKILGIFNLAMSWIIPLGLMVIYSINAVSDLIKIMLLGIIPAMIGVSILRNAYKFAKNGVPADEKTFNYYGALSIIQILIFLVSLTVFKWTSPVALVVMILTALPIFYEVFIVKDKDLSFLKHTLVSITCVVAFLALVFLLLTGEKADSIENETQAIIFIGLFSSGWLSTYFSFASVLISKYYYCKRTGISKYFGAVVKKPVFKKGRAVKSAIAIVLACAVVFATIYIAPVVLLDGAMSTAIDGFNEEKVETRYIDYNKEDITFGEDEQVVTIEEENYNIKLPVYLEKNEKITTRDGYQNKEKMTVVFIEEIYFDYSDVFTYDGDDEENKASFERLNKTIKDRYGFIPKGQYEYFKLLKLISEDNISPFNRDLSLAVSLFTNLEKMLAYDNVYLYEDSEKCFCICENIIERESGNFTHTYSINGNAKGDYDKFFSITVMVVTETPADMDLPFKIINSIEMK